MKNSTLLITTLFLITFSCLSAQTRPHRLRFLGGTLQEAQNLYCSDTFNPDDRGITLKLNITNLNTPYPVGTILFINRPISSEGGFWRVQSSSTNAPFQDDDATYSSSIIFVRTISCVLDSDGDSVPDNQDDCPNQAGPVSNNGCPGNPDLVLDANNTAIFSSDCSIFVCNPVLSQLGSTRYRINSVTGFIDFNNIRIKNEGNTESNPTSITFYISGNTTLDDDDNELASISLSSINSGNYRDITGPALNANNELNNLIGNLFILIVIDDDDNNTESNENNNITAVGINIFTPSTQGISHGSGIEPISGFQSRVSIEQFSSVPYTINIYNFNGQLVLSKKVSSQNEENQTLQNLSTSGIYIVKTEKETRKVFVNNN